LVIKETGVHQVHQVFPKFTNYDQVHQDRESSAYQLERTKCPFNQVWLDAILNIGNKLGEKK